MHTPSRRAGTRAISALVTVVAVLLVIVACGGSPTTSGGSSATGSGDAGSAAGGAAAPNTITIKDFKFLPSEITVSPGAKVTVTNQDTVVHTVTANDKAFDTGNLAGGQGGELTAPSKPGSYPFICTPHPYMTGTLVVK